MAKTFGLSFNEVLYEMSYVNLIMYSNTIPSYNDYKDKAGNKDGQKNKQMGFGEFMTALKNF